MPLRFPAFLLISFLILTTGLNAQRIIYSDPDDNDGRMLTAYEILGKMGPNVLIYKNYKDDHFISVYDPEMKQTSKTKLEKIPERLINADFINYPDHAYMIYQYQKKST